MATNRLTSLEKRVILPSSTTTTYMKIILEKYIL